MIKNGREGFMIAYWTQMAWTAIIVFGLWRLAVRRRRNEAVDEVWDVSVPAMAIIAAVVFLRAVLT